MQFFIIVSLFVMCVIRSVYAQVNIEKLYHEAVELYLEENWTKSIKYFETLMYEWRKCESALFSCRRKCGHERDVKSTIGIIRRANCELDCRPPCCAKENVSEELSRRAPYNHLHLAYYKVNDLERSVSYALSFFLRNSDNLIASSTLRNLQSMPGIRSSYFKDLDAGRHEKSLLAVAKDYELYGADKTLLETMKNGLFEFFNQLDHCFARCQKPINRNQEFGSEDGDLASNIGIHLSLYLNCSTFCEESVSILNGEFRPDYLQIYLHYLEVLATEAGDDDCAKRSASSLRLFEVSLGESLDAEPNVFLPVKFILQRKRDLDFIAGLLNELDYKDLFFT